MSIDWKRLIELREQQKTTVLELVAQDRKKLAASQADAQLAQAQWREHLATKAAHWEEIASALSGGAFNAGQMRDAAAGSRALDAQIQMASQGVARAEAVVAQRTEALEASRGELRAADGELVKARKMLERTQAEQRQARELQMEDAAEEAALQRWLGRKPS
jgi:hypothetical protein